MEKSHGKSHGTSHGTSLGNSGKAMGNIP